uniref:ribosomal protein S3 n=1 Tax=Grosmannia fruticeta TaxID=340915 RepID=UPI0027A2033F|nr:ribosomal protein S3 [Grosmannia fruticeta]WHN64119.1 ribosomal protein S3 [Grosmannia fruticeta]
MQKDTKFLSNIFVKNINNKYKSIPLNTRINFVGETRYFPSDFKEWTNSVYYFNSNNIKNLPVYDLNVSKLLKGYFDLYFNRENIKSNYKSGAPLEKKDFTAQALNKIFVSKPEIKHTNSKAIITIYVYNRERVILFNKLNQLNIGILGLNKFFYLCKKISGDLYSKYIKQVLYKEFLFLRRSKLKLNLNGLKFQDKFLFKLSKLISKFYKKKVEFNIINLKSINLNPNIFTEIMAKKFMNRNASIMQIMKFILDKSIILNEEGRFSPAEKSRKIKNVNLNLIENKYKNLNINSIVTDGGFAINEGRFSPAIKEFYTKNSEDTIFDSIKYKNLGGIRLEAKGRLTRRYRADRAVSKVNIKGGLKNIDSSYKGLSSINFIGKINSSMEYSMDISKRRVGAFAIKGWISGK